MIIQDSGSVKAPEYSHTANRSYAIVQEYNTQGWFYQLQKWILLTFFVTMKF